MGPMCALFSHLNVSNVGERPFSVRTIPLETHLRDVNLRNKITGILSGVHPADEYYIVVNV